jgi:hypothetical protein
VRNWDFLPDSRGDPVRAAETHRHPWRWSLEAPSSPQHRPDAPEPLGRPLGTHIEERERPCRYATLRSPSAANNLLGRE